MIYIVDTYTWIENFRGTSQGLILEKLLQNKNNKFVTMECSIAELLSYCLREGYDFNKLYNIVKINSIILPILRNHWLNAAKIKSKYRRIKKHFGLLDAILIAKQQELKCKIISGDTHFKNLKNVVYVG